MSEATATEKAFVPSVYQLAVKTAITDDTDNLAIMAVAGSGKTRTLRMICETLPTSTSIIALCFNKSIAEEFQRKLPKNVQASTMHSLALRICKSAGQIIVDNENKKFDGIIEEFCGPMRGRPFPMIQLSADLNKLIPFVRNTMTDMNSQSDILEMCIEYGLELQNPEQSIPFVPRVIGKLRADRIMVTFDDMLDFCVHFELPMPQCEYILVDEAQDLNRLQAAFIKRLAGSADRIRHMEEMQSYSLFSSLIEKPKPLNRKTGSRIIVVGDPRQAIYSFRGASPTSMVDLIDAFECRELPLSVCYRCVRSVVRTAQGVIGENAIQWHEDNGEGIVERRPFEDLGNTMLALQDGDMVVCRTNAPLIRNALRLIAAGRKALIKGRDIGETLSSLIKKAQKKTGSTEDLERFYPALHEVVRRTILGLLHQDKVTQAIGTMDRYETILAIGESCSYVSDIEAGLSRIFSESKTTGVQFSSIHKAKGLEAKLVVFLGPEKIPHPAAYYAINAKTALVQEQNMLYVGITRAMEHLIMQSITPPDSGAVGALPVFGQFTDCELLYNEIRANRGK
jgi:DNA helicase II / ATP-dependent DNA helicase PcrA